MTTFEVDKVTPQAPEFGNTISRKWHEHYMRQELARVGVKNIEASKFNHGEGKPFSLVRPDVNSFVQTALMSYADHVPLVLSPDDVWVTILQAIAKHIELNPEESRRALVNFDGKSTLVVEADDFQKGSSDNDWERVFGQFNDQLEMHIGKKRSLFDATFSTTQRTEKAAIQVQVMAALAPYFNYVVLTRCGIPSITLLGTPEDWKSIHQRAVAFGEFYPKWAHEPLCMVTEQFALAAANELKEPAFWKNFVKHHGASGGPYVSGYINAFFPYIRNRPNGMMFSSQENKQKDFTLEVLKAGSFSGTREDSFPGSVTTVPLEWKYYGKSFSMRLASGIFGTTVHGAGYRPVIGWALGENRNAATDDEKEELTSQAQKEFKVHV